MRKRNHTVTIRMNKEEYNLLQNKVKESGRTQQEVVIKAIADLKIASAEEVEELKRLNQMFADILCQLREQLQISIRLQGSCIQMEKSQMTVCCISSIKIFSSIGRRVREIWQLIRRLISGQIHMEQ